MSGEKHFGYYVFGKDLKNLKITTLKENGVTDIFLNYYAFTLYKEEVLNIIQTLKDNGIMTHIWVQCFYNGEWVNPVKADLNSKKKEIKYYSNLKNVYGVNLDYLRYPGNAYKTKNGTSTITSFVEEVRKENPKTFLSCSVMSEDETSYYYGQDIPSLSKNCDAILPMQYKGNYGGGTSWLKSTTQYFKSKSSSPVWSALQSYKSDDDTTILSASELLSDTETCLDNGASGCIMFRYGLSPVLDFTPYNPKTIVGTSSYTVTPVVIRKLAEKTKDYIEKNKKYPKSFTINNKKYSVGQVNYLLSYAVNNPNKNISLISVNESETQEYYDKINENLLKGDYQDISKRLYNYIKSNKALPNYVVTQKSKKKLNPKTYTYMLARIIVYYYNHSKTMPLYANANTRYY